MRAGCRRCPARPPRPASAAIRRTPPARAWVRPPRTSRGTDESAICGVHRMRCPATASGELIIAKNARAICMQPFAQRHLGMRFEQGGGQLLLAERLGAGGEQALLVAEMAVDGELGHAGRGGDLVHAGAVEALGREQPLGGFQDRRAFVQILRPAGSGGAWRAWRGRAIGPSGENTRLTRFDIYTIPPSSLISRLAWCSAWQSRPIGSSLDVRDGCYGPRPRPSCLLAGCGDGAAHVGCPRPVLVVHPGDGGAGVGDGLRGRNPCAPGERTVVPRRRQPRAPPASMPATGCKRRGARRTRPGDQRLQAQAAQAQLPRREAELARAARRSHALRATGEAQLVSRSALDAQNAAYAAAAARCGRSARNWTSRATPPATRNCAHRATA